MVDPVSADERRRKQRDRHRPMATPSTSPPPQRIPVEEIVKELRPHLLSPKKMWAMGYPLELEPNSCKAVVYINPPPRPRILQFTSFDVNAPEFVPSASQSDSGRGSLGSSPRSESDEESDTVKHLCTRCDKMFKMTKEGEYLEDESCVYHWGRISGESRHSCCNLPLGSRGCTTSRYHVWSGTKPGMNGPLEGYVRAKSPRGGVYAIDTEMCYTTAGLELASVAVIASDGRLVYKSLVKPSAPVLDHNTRFSGIRPRDLARATKTLRDVQNDILGFVGSDTILIGHALDNDLRALKLLHSAVVDTCALYPHSRGFPMRRSLRALSEELLGRSVQRSSAGHSPIEDARAAMDLVLLKLSEESSHRTRSYKLPILQPYDPLINGSVILWDVRDFENQKEHKTLRVNIEFDHASHIAWSPDSKAFIVHTVRDNRIVVYKIERKKDGTIGSAAPVITFEKVHEEDVIGFGISSNGKFMMSCSSKTDMVIWDLKGQQLERLDTYLMSTYTAKISPCGRFVVATGFSPDVKVMEVCFTRTGEYKQVAKAYELTGHSSGVYDVAFAVDTSHIATISKDGTWKLYHTNIDYVHGESPHVLETGTYTQTANPPHIALSPNAEVLAVSCDSSVEFYDTYTGQLYDTVEHIYTGLINCMYFDASGKYLFVGGDRAVRILHNVCGYHTTIASCSRLLKSKQTSATVERLNKTIQECKATLAKFGK